jgi:hypothetical protein
MSPFVYLLIAIAGAVASWGSYSSAQNGGHYYIFWGAVVFSLIRFAVAMGDHVHTSPSPMSQCARCGQRKPVFKAGTGPFAKRVGLLYA